MAEYTKYQKKQLYFSTDNGVTWKPYNPPVYKRGDVIETNSPDCGYSEPQYRWYGNDTSDFICSNFNKYYREYYQVSNDGGKTWQNVEPLQTRVGGLIEQNSYDCDYGVTWEIVDDSYVCVLASETFRWVESGTMCDGNNSYQRMIQQVSYDDGKTWTDVAGTEMKGDLIMSPSPDCSSYEFTWNETGNLICCGETSYKELIYQYDDNGTWKDVTPIQTKKGDLVTGEFGICILEMDNTNITNVGEINPYQGEMQDYFKVGNKLYAIQPNEAQAIQSQTYTLYELNTNDFVNPTKSTRILRYGGGNPSTCSPYKPEGNKDYYSSGGRTILGGEYNIKSDVGYTQCYCYIEPDVNSNLIKYIDISENWNERYNTDYNKPPFIYPAMTTATFNLTTKKDIEGRAFTVVQINGQDFNLPYSITECSYTSGNFLFLPNNSTFAFKGKHDGKVKLFVIYNNKLYSITPSEIEIKLRSVYGERFDSYDDSMNVYYISNDGICYVNCGIMLKNESVRRYDVVGIKLKAASNDCHEGEGAKPVPDPNPGEYEYRWVDVVGETICNGVNLCQLQKLQRRPLPVVDDNWEDTGTTRAGSILEVNSVKCGYINGVYIITEEAYTLNPNPSSIVQITPNFPSSTNVEYSIRAIYDLKNSRQLNGIYTIVNSQYYYNIIEDNGNMRWANWLAIYEEKISHIYDNFVFNDRYRYDINTGNREKLNIADGAIFYDRYAIAPDEKVLDIINNSIVQRNYKYYNIYGYEPCYNFVNKFNDYLNIYSLDGNTNGSIQFNIPNRNPELNQLNGGDSVYAYALAKTNYTYKGIGFINISENKVYDALFTYDTTSAFLNEQFGAMLDGRIFYSMYRENNDYYLRKYQI